MKKHMRRGISALTVAAMILTMIPVLALGVTAEETDANTFVDSADNKVYISYDTSTRYYYPSGDVYNGMADLGTTFNEYASAADPSVPLTFTTSGWGSSVVYSVATYNAGDLLYYNFVVAADSKLTIELDRFGEHYKATGSTVSVNSVIAEKHGTALVDGCIGPGTYEGLIDLGQFGFEDGYEINGGIYAASGTVTMYPVRILTATCVGLTDYSNVTEADIVNGKVMQKNFAIALFDPQTLEGTKVELATRMVDNSYVLTTDRNSKLFAFSDIPTLWNLYLKYDFTISGYDAIEGDKSVTLYYSMVKEFYTDAGYIGASRTRWDIAAAVLKAEGKDAWTDGHYSGVIAMQDLFEETYTVNDLTSGTEATVDLAPRDFYLTSGQIGITSGAIMQVDALEAVNYVTVANGGETGNLLKYDATANTYTIGEAVYNGNADGSLSMTSSMNGTMWYVNYALKPVGDADKYLHFDFVGNITLKSNLWDGSWESDLSAAGAAAPHYSNSILAWLGISEFVPGVRYSGYMPMSELLDTNGVKFSERTDVGVDNSIYYTDLYVHSAWATIYALEVTTTSTAVTTGASVEPTLKMLGAGARESDTLDLRFGLEVNDKDWNVNSNADMVLYGTVLMPTALVPSATTIDELTLKTENMLDIQTKKWQTGLLDENGVAYAGDVYTSVLTGVPTTDTSVTARGFMIYEIGNQCYVTYTKAIARTMDDVYTAAYAAQNG